MEITEVRIKLMENSEDRLRGFCSVTFDDCFVIRDLKIIEGNNGPFVAMPSRKLTSNCFKCRTKNHLRAKFCNNCGSKQRVENIAKDQDGRARLYADIAHPVNASCREMIQTRVIQEFHEEMELAKEPGYVSRYDDDYQITDDRSMSRKSHRVDSAEEPSAGSHIDSDQPPRIDANDRPTDSFGEGILD